MSAWFGYWYSQMSNIGHEMICWYKIKIAMK